MLKAIPSTSIMNPFLSLLVWALLLFTQTDTCEIFDIKRYKFRLGYRISPSTCECSGYKDERVDKCKFYRHAVRLVNKNVNRLADNFEIVHKGEGLGKWLVQIGLTRLNSKSYTTLFKTILEKDTINFLDLYSNIELNVSQISRDLARFSSALEFLDIVDNTPSKQNSLDLSGMQNSVLESFVISGNHFKVILPKLIFFPKAWQVKIESNRDVQWQHFVINAVKNKNVTLQWSINPHPKFYRMVQKESDDDFLKIDIQPNVGFPKVSNKFGSLTLN